MRWFVFLFFLFFSLSFAQLKVVATYPWIGELVKEIGGDRVSVYVIAKGSEDPHFVVPKPSHVARLRNADLLIVQGAQLEIGFLPPLLSQSNNPRIKPGREGFLDLSGFVQLIEVPQQVSRAMGDIHPEGNPHYNLDPHNIPVLAKAVKDKLCSLEKESCSQYERNLSDFLKRWEVKLEVWDRDLSNLKGTKFIAYHSLFNYLLRRYEALLVGTVEPLPGIPPTGKHVEKLLALEDVRFVITDVYHERRTPEFVAKKLGAELVILPHDVGALPEVKDLFSLFDEIVRRLRE